MESIGTKKLETNRLILRKGTLNDAKEIYENYGKDPLVSKYVVWNQHDSIDDAINLMKKWEESYSTTDSYKWVVVLKETNKIIGSITAVKVDKKYNVIGLGYCYGSKWWNKGYATEALKRVIKFFFEEVKAETIIAEHLEHNPASGKVMEKSGMKYEGVLRNRTIDKNTNKQTSLLSYSIIKSEYFHE